MKRYLAFFALIFLFSACISVQVKLVEEHGLLHLEKGKVVNQAGNEVTLRGVNFGNWLVLEMWMLDYAGRGVADQFEFENALRDRFGDSERHRLMEVYRENYIQAEDFDRVPEFGMNTVRVPFEYRLLMDDDRPFELRPDAFKWLDRAVDWAAERDIFVILDMHGAPGRQSGMDHCGRSGYNQLWVSDEAQAQTIWLWKEISKHYIQNTTVAAYDFLNEPWGGSEEELRDIILRLHDAVRALGDEHIVIFPGHYSGIDFYYDEVERENVMYTAHFYPGFFGWGAPVPQVHADFLENGLNEWRKTMDKFEAPLLVGEFNVVSKRAGGGEMMRRYFDRYAAEGWPATMWAYKVLSQQGGVGKMNWYMVSNAEPLPEFNILEDSKEEIEAWFRHLGSMKIAADEDLQYWMTTKKEPSKLDDLPPLPPAILNAPPSTELPEGFFSKDIGDCLRGAHIFEDEVITLYGAGADIWNDNDHFRFLWKSVDGNFEATVTVDSLLNTNSYAKAGLMIRADETSNSPLVLMNVFPFGNSEFSYRTEKAGVMRAHAGPVGEIPNMQLKLRRNENSFEGFVLQDGNWVSAGTVEIPDFPKTAMLGLVALSHDAGQLTIAKYCDFEITSRIGGVEK